MSERIVFAVFEFGAYSGDLDRINVLSHWTTRSGALCEQRRLENERERMAKLGFPSTRRWAVAAFTGKMVHEQ